MTWWPRRGPVVDVDESGRGGSITYREGDDELRFYWEFATGDTVALVFGPPAAGFDADYPWATDGGPRSSGPSARPWWRNVRRPAVPWSISTPA